MLSNVVCLKKEEQCGKKLTIGNVDKYVSIKMSTILLVNMNVELK